MTLTPEFYVGQRVRRKIIAGAWHRCLGGDIVTIAEIRGTAVKLLEHGDMLFTLSSFEPTEEPSLGITEWFKVGDRVKIVYNTSGGNSKYLGNTYTIKRIENMERPYAYFVEMGECFYLADLELVKPELKVKTFREYVISAVNETA